MAEGRGVLGLAERWGGSLGLFGSGSGSLGNVGEGGGQRNAFTLDSVEGEHQT